MVVLTVFVVILVLVLKRRKNQKTQAGESQSEDLNPVYGMYYFSDGGRIDQSQSEVADGNDYYGK